MLRLHKDRALELSVVHESNRHLVEAIAESALSDEFEQAHRLGEYTRGHC